MNTSTTSTAPQHRTGIQYGGTQLTAPFHFVPAKTWATMKLLNHTVYMYRIVGEVFSAILVANDSTREKACIKARPEMEVLRWVADQDKTIKAQATAKPALFTFDNAVANDTHKAVLKHYGKWCMFLAGDSAIYVIPFNNTSGHYVKRIPLRGHNDYFANRYGTEQLAHDAVMDLVKKAEAFKARKDAERKAATTERNKPSTLKQGDILVYSFGYNMTIVKFLQITSVKGNMAHLMTLSHDGNGYYGTCSPILDSDGEGFTARLRGDNCVKVGDHYARLWDGKPCYFNSLD